MTNRAEFERLLDVYGFRCERFGQDLSTHARAQVVSAFAALASAPVAGEAQAAIILNAVDEDGPLLGWTKHWVEYPIGTKFYAAPQASECECSRKSKAVSDSEAQL